MKHYLLCIIMIVTVFFTACKGKEDNNSQIQNAQAITKPTAAVNESGNNEKDSIIVNEEGKQYIFKVQSWDTLMLVNYPKAGEKKYYVVGKELRDEQITDLKKVDYNKDGCEDIIVEYGMANRYQEGMIVYNSEKKEFQLVPNYWEYSGAKPIKGNEKFYYSYRSSGCADEAWLSTLFTFENYKVAKLGIIKRSECDPEIPDIFVYKIKDGNELQIEKVSKNDYEKNKKNKFAFIEEYWNKNYKNFIK